MRSLIAGAAALFLPPSIALAAPPACPTWQDFADKLAAEYGEKPAALAGGPDRGMVQVYVSPGGATWTMVLVNENGCAAPLAAGEGWRTIPGPRR